MAAGPAALLRACVGERWVVRHRLPDGSATDVLGWLEQVDADRIVLTDLEGRQHSVSGGDVFLARRVPAAAGGPDPRRVSAQTLERRVLPGWLADHQPLGEWTLRAGGGFTGRANSCQAVGDPGLPVVEAAARIVAYASEHRIAPMAQVVRDSDADRALRGLGWTDTYEPTEVLVARLADFLGSALPSPEVKVSEIWEQEWLAAYRDSRPNRADPALLEQILAGNPPRAFAWAVADGTIVAIGRGHLSEDWLGLASIWVRPEHRRRGLATAMMRNLGHWAARGGARYLYLQVAAANTAAIGAYERLGLVEHHAYGYLRPPGLT